MVNTKHDIEILNIIYMLPMHEQSKQACPVCWIQLSRMPSFTKYPLRPDPEASHRCVPFVYTRLASVLALFRGKLSD